MRLRVRRPAVLTAAVCAGVVVGAVLSSPVGSIAGLGNQAVSESQISTVGALFTRTASGKLGTHYCTGSVVASPAGDLVLTAAHCVTGIAARAVAFVPEYSSGRMPFGAWTVTQIIVDQSWASSRNPDDDFAFLIVHRPGASISLQRLTGGELIGVGESPGHMVKVAGYPDGGDQVIGCDNTAIAFSPTQFEFDCDGFTDGTSGSPLLVDDDSSGGLTTVIGVIGGYEQGGSTASVSYAARFSSRLAALYQQALLVSAG